MASEVKAVPIVRSRDWVIAQVADAWEALVGGEAPAGCLAALAAHIWIETGGHFWCGNVGNIRGQGPEGLWCTLGHATEIIDGKEVVVGGAFRAYAGPAWLGAPSGSDEAKAVEGLRDFVRFVATATGKGPNRFQAAIDAAARGDFAGYVHGLKAGGYMTAGEGRYAHGLMSCEALLEGLPQLAAYMHTQAPTVAQ